MTLFGNSTSPIRYLNKPCLKVPHEHGRPKAIDVAAFAAESANSSEEDGEDGGGGGAGKKSEAEKNNGVVAATSGSSEPKGSEKRKGVTRPEDEFDVTDKYNQVRGEHTNFHCTLHSLSGLIFHKNPSGKSANLHASRFLRLPIEGILNILCPGFKQLRTSNVASPRPSVHYRTALFFCIIPRK